MWFLASTFSYAIKTYYLLKIHFVFVVFQKPQFQKIFFLILVFLSAQNLIYLYKILCFFFTYVLLHVIYNSVEISHDVPQQFKPDHSHENPFSSQNKGKDIKEHIFD